MRGGFIKPITMIKVFKTPCKNCLFSKDRIVSPQRAKGILKDCTKKQTHFICHKASMNGEDICCSRFYTKLGHLSPAIVLFKKCGLIRFIEQQESVRLPSHNDLNK